MSAKDWAKAVIGTAGVVANIHGGPMDESKIRAEQEKARVEEQKRELEEETRRANEERDRAAQRP